MGPTRRLADGSRLRRFVPSQRARTVGAFTTLSLTLATLALLHDGTEVADLELNDGGVWVTALDLADGHAVTGHLNYEAREIDSFAEPASQQFDISQEGTAVVVHDPADRPAISWVDTATWAAGTPSPLPRGATAAQGADVVAIADPNAGAVWAFPAAEASRFSTDATPPTLEGVVGARAVVGKDDTVHVVTPDGTVQTLERTGDTWTASESGSVPSIDDNEEVQVAAVGSTPVVYNANARWVAWPGERVDLDGVDGLADPTALVLQQSGDDRGSVALAGPSVLLQLPLDGGAPVTSPTTGVGEAITPVSVAGCTYAAWTGTGDYVRDCAGEDHDETRVVDKLRDSGDTSAWSFRANRDLVVLNDEYSGTIILVNENMEVLEDPWRNVRQELEEEDDENDEQTPEHQRRENENPPKPEDDEFGVRAGQSITLPVLANDIDADGDVLTVKLPESRTRIGDLTSVRGGRAVRLSVPDDATGTASFQYLADDGEHTAPATVSLRIHADGVNSGAQLLAPGLREPALTIKERGTGTYPVLQDYIDEDGDPMWIAGVASARGLTTVWEPDGMVSVADVGRETDDRRRIVKVTMTDGRGGATTIDLPVTVLPLRAANEPPVANADFVTVQPGIESIVDPLRNDTDPDSPKLYPSIVKVPPALRQQHIGNDTYAVSAARNAKPGSYYIEYEVSDGEETDTSVIRVDVRPSDTAVPVPDDDLAVVPPDGEALVPVLANDTDPLGGILVLSSVDSGGAAVSAEVVNHEFLRVEHNGAPPGPSRLSYVVANAAGEAEGSVTVVVPDPEEPRRSGPVAVDDEAVVRSGDVVTVDVLANDTDPTDQPLTVDHDVEVTVGADLGTAFVSEDRVRFVATGEAGEARIQYLVRDPDGNVDSAKVRVTIQPTSGSHSPPTPKALTARLFEGGTAEIDVPLDSIDPDGDSVSLVGLSEAPRLGQVVVGTEQLTYRAAQTDQGLGTDTFTYVVEDEYGEVGFGQVRVGVVARPTSNKPPIALRDSLRVQPGRELSIPVTANDNDPEGGTLTLTGVEPAAGTDVDASVDDDGRVSLTTPEETVTLEYLYTVEDELGATAEGAVEVLVDPDAEPLAPIARDDRVPLAHAVAHTSVTVDVLGNDEDPDGSVRVLPPEPEADGITVTDAGELAIPVTAERQVIPYTLTDQDGETGRAVVVVPGNATDRAQGPVLRDDAALPVPVTAGTVEEIDLRDLVLVRDGREPVLHLTEDVAPGPGHDGSGLVGEDHHVITFGARGSKGQQPGFYGPTSVTAKVYDGPPEEDDLRSATLTVPIEVIADGRTPPVVQVPLIEVAAADPPWRRPLDLIVTDPDEGDQERLEFEAAEAPDGASDGLTLGTEDGVLSVAVDDSVRIGDTREFDLRVSGGSPEPVTERFLVKVVDSTLPLVQLRQGVTVEAEAGEPVEVELDDLVLSNPYPDTPVELVGTPTAPRGAATVDPGDRGFTVTPSAGYDGTFDVAFRVKDANGSPDRYVAGTVRFVVAGPPDAPVIQRPEVVDATSVEVNWLAGDDNGSPITGFTINVEGGSTVDVQGLRTSAIVDGLTPGKEYRFQVVAHNEVDSSEPSEWTGTVTPDALPPAPTGLTVQPGDQRLELSWSMPDYEGTRPVEYHVRINGTVVRTGSTRQTYNAPGLVNGRDYRVQVRAVNQAEEPGPDGAIGAGPWTGEQTARPVGEAAATAVEASPDLPDNDLSTTVSWQVDANGGTVTEAQVKNAAGRVTTCTGHNVSSCHVDLRKGVDEQFRVRLRNEKTIDNPDGWGSWSKPSNTVRGAGAPDPVPSFTPSATGQSGTARFTFDYPRSKGNGAPDVRFEISPGTIGPVTGYGRHTVTVTGLPNGTTTQISVRAITTANGFDSAPSGAGTGSVRPFAPCTVSVNAGTSGYRKHTFSYSVVSNGRPCSFSGSDGGQPSGGQSEQTRNGTRTVNGIPEGGSVTLTVTAQTHTSGNDQPAGGVALTTSDRATGSAWGSSRVRAVDGGAAPNNTGNCLTDCRYFGAELTNFEPGAYGYCAIVHVGSWRDGQRWWYRVGPADNSGYWRGRMRSAQTGRPLAWSTGEFGSDPPDDGCQKSRPSGNIDE